VMFFLQVKSIIVLITTPSICAEVPQELTSLVLFEVLTIVGYMPHSDLSERFGENTKSKEVELQLLYRFGHQLHGGT
jgi:hypothetical protein